MKKVLVNKEAHDTILQGLQILHDPVASTLGPCGRNVLIETQGVSYITKDGATVARYIEQLESDTNQGIRLLKMVSQKMAKEVGDGTTTATILAYQLLKNLMESVHSRGNKISLSELEDSLVKYKDELVAAVKTHAIDCKTAEDIEKVAKVSTNNNKEMAARVMTAFGSLDPDSAVVLEEHDKDHDEVILSKGFQWNNGYLSPRFITDISTGRADLENPLIFMTTDQLQHPNSVRPLMALAAGLDPETEKPILGKEKRPLLIIARDVRSLALAMLIDNHIRGSLHIPICAVEAPGDLDTMTKYLEDLRAVVGGKVFYNHETARLKKMKLTDFGSATKVLIEHNKTTVITETQSQDVIDRVSALKLEKAETADAHSKNILNSRITKLMGEMVHIKVGASTKAEVMEKRDRYEDAIYAVKASLRNGYIPGGAVLPKMLTQSYFDKVPMFFKPHAEDDIAKHALYKSLTMLTETLLDNSGRSDDYKHVGSKKYYSYNLAKKERKLVSMLDEGIIEPVDILVSSLEQAVSLALTVIRTNTLILYDRQAIKQ